MKILIIAFYYPPEESWAKVASLRPAAWAKYWSRLGHQVYVLTEFKAHSSPSNPAEKIVGVRYWPSRPTTAKSGVLQGDKPTANHFQQTWYQPLRSAIRAIRQHLHLGSFGQLSDFWILPALNKAIQLHDSVNFDVVVSTYGPPANHIVAATLARRRKLFWVADYRDLWCDNHFLQTNSALAVVENIVERSCIQRANLLTTVSTGLAETLSTRFETPVLTIENGFDLDDLPTHRTEQWSDRKKRIAYTGTIYWGKQDPTPLLKALSLLQEERPNLYQELEVLFYGWNLNPLQTKAEEHGVSPILKINTALPREEVLKVQTSVDALLFLDWSDLSTKGILTGKLFEYCFADKPIIGIGSSPETSAGQLMLELGTGIPVGFSVEKISSLLKLLLSDQPLPYAPVPNKIERFTRENLADKMLEGILEEMQRQAAFQSTPH